MARESRTYEPEDNPEVHHYADGTVVVEFGEEEEDENDEDNGE